MKTEIVVSGLSYNRSIVKFTSHGQDSYKVKQGNKFIGKTKDGGYKSIESAIKFAESVL